MKILILHLVILSWTTSAGFAATLYTIYSNGSTMKPPVLDYSPISSNFGYWSLLNGTSVSLNGGAPITVTGLDAGDALISITAWASDLVFGKAIPEPSTITLLLGVAFAFSALHRKRSAGTRRNSNLKI